MHPGLGVGDRDLPLDASGDTGELSKRMNALRIGPGTARLDLGGEITGQSKLSSPQGDGSLYRRMAAKFVVRGRGAVGQPRQQ